MPESGDSFPAGTSAVVSGWGVTDAGGSSDVLMAVDVKIDSDAGNHFSIYVVFVQNVTIKKHLRCICDIPLYPSPRQSIKI